MAKRSNSSRNHPSVKNIVIIIILILIVIIGGVIAASFFFQPERQVKQKFESIATKYYESNIYDSMLKSDHYSGNPNDSLERYSERGMTPVTLRQLLHLDDSISADVADYLRKYCDVNATTAKFYPDPPFSRTDYHVEYTYACNF